MSGCYDNSHEDRARGRELATYIGSMEEEGVNYCPTGEHETNETLFTCPDCGRTMCPDCYTAIVDGICWDCFLDDCLIEGINFPPEKLIANREERRAGLRINRSILKKIKEQGKYLRSEKEIEDVILVLAKIQNEEGV